MSHDRRRNRAGHVCQTERIVSCNQKDPEMTHLAKGTVAQLLLLACLRVDAVAQVGPDRIRRSAPARSIVPLARLEQGKPRPLRMPEAYSLPATSTAPRNSCPNRLVLGGALGAGAGFGLGYALLAKSAGSDSAGAILRATTVIGLGAGLLAGLIACAP